MRFNFAASALAAAALVGVVIADSPTGYLVTSSSTVTITKTVEMAVQTTYMSYPPTTSSSVVQPPVASGIAPSSMAPLPHGNGTAPSGSAPSIPLGTGVTGGNGFAPTTSMEAPPQVTENSAASLTSFGFAAAAGLVAFVLC